MGSRLISWASFLHRFCLAYIQLASKGLEIFYYSKQLIHRWSVGGVVAEMDEAQDAILIQDKVAAKLGGVIFQLRYTRSLRESHEPH